MAKVKIILSVLCLTMLAACEPSASIEQYGKREEVDIKNINRIHVQRIAIIRDDIAYSNSRGVYLITDRKTGKEYIGLSGVGISEAGSHLSGKTVVADER